MKNLNNTKFLINIVLAAVLSIGTLWSQESTDVPPENTSTIAGASGETGVRYMPIFSLFKLQRPNGSSLDADFVLGHCFVGFVGFNFSGRLSIQVEMMFSSLAQKYKTPVDERQINLQYVNIPVLLSLNTGKYKTVNLNIVAGPQLGVNLGANTEITGKGTDAQDSVHTSIALKTCDIGFAYGAGIDFGLGVAHLTRLGIGFRGVFGLIDVSNNSNSQSTNYYYILDRTQVQTYAAYISLSHLLK